MSNVSYDDATAVYVRGPTNSHSTNCGLIEEAPRQTQLLLVDRGSFPITWDIIGSFLTDRHPLNLTSGSVDFLMSESGW